MYGRYSTALLMKSTAGYCSRKVPPQKFPTSLSPSLAGASSSWRNVSSRLDTVLGEMRCVDGLHRQHLWGSLTDGAPGIKGPLRG